MRPDFIRYTCKSSILNCLVKKNCDKCELMDCGAIDGVNAGVLCHAIKVFEIRGYVMSP